MRNKVVTPPHHPEMVSYEAFKIEKDAKNKAYDFILSQGHYEAFVKFNREYRSEEPHSDCLDTLKSK